MTVRADSDGVVVALEDLHKAFGDLVVLDGLDLEVRQGEKPPWRIGIESWIC